MFKRFLKFFRGEEESPEEPFEGSYLDHLLEQVRPLVEEQLEECPEHDPLLLVVVGILRHTMMGEWSPALRCPLTDSQSPGVRPPPPPVALDEVSNPADESDITNEFDGVEPPGSEGGEATAEDEEAVDGEVDGDDLSGEDADHPEEPPSDDADDDPSDENDEPTEGAEGEEASDDQESAEEQDESDDQESAEEQESAEDQESGDDQESAEEQESADDEESAGEQETGGEDASDGESERSEDDLEITDEDIYETVDADGDEAGHSTRRKTEEIDVEEIRQASMRAAATETMERERLELEPDPTVEIEQDTIFEAQSADGRPRVDTEEVLQAGRVFLGLLIENDRLPVELQLSVAETTLARDLLLGYFVGNDDFEAKARQLLTLVEQKFGEGLFSQARILLQLFHTDEQTRVNNDRNLFYEDMILRLGIRRRHRMSASEIDRFNALLEEAKSPQGISSLCQWLSETCLIAFHCFNRDPDEVVRWRDLIDASTREGAEENFLKYLPPRRWRPVGHYADLDPVQQLVRHVSEDTARGFVIAQLKTCYFVLRAVGDTGLEGYLDTFFDWTDNTFGINGTSLMPRLYQRSMMDPDPMANILREIYDDTFAAPTVELLDSWSDGDVEEAAFAAFERFSNYDLGEIAPGYYDLGAFVYDELFDVSYPSTEFAFKIHRLT
jgi:hypothetical protein